MTNEETGAEGAVPRRRLDWLRTQAERFYRSKVVQGVVLMGLSLAIILIIAKLFAGDKGLDLFRFQLLADGTFALALSPWSVAILLIWGFLFWWFFLPRGDPWEATEINVEVARIGKVIMRPNQEVAGLAHRAWAEIITRKAGMEFNEEDDVIVEIYDSWYELFREIRSLLKTIPVDKLRTNKDAERLCDMLIDVLNKILRPHLTKYQAKFRAWYQSEVGKGNGAAPQEIQRNYQGYAELVKDMKETNAAFMDAARTLRIIAIRSKKENGN